LIHPVDESAETNKKIDDPLFSSPGDVGDVGDVISGDSQPQTMDKFIKMVIRGGGSSSENDSGLNNAAINLDNSLNFFFQKSLRRPPKKVKENFNLTKKIIEQELFI
jgi:hypothetical protein